VELLLARHENIVSAHPGALLQRAEQGATREHNRHQSIRARVRDAEHETARLVERQGEVLAPVPRDWNPSFDFSALARTSPLSHNWGYDRGTPADRPLIERYLASHAEDIHGAVLEIQEDDYTKKFGGQRVERSDVLDLDVTNPRATLIGDLRALDHIESGSYDAIILTQTIHVVDDMRAVVRECERLLKPGGTLLATLPSASRVCLEYGPEGDFWRVTDAGARRVFEDAFPVSAIETTSLGNPLVNAAFGFGLASEDLPASAYDSHDAYFPMVIGVRARKGGVAERGTPAFTRRSTSERGIALMYHRVGAPGRGPHHLSVSEAAFRAQIEWLARTCSIVTLEELARGNRSSRSNRAVALTFDDGYLDNLSVAAPVLRASGAPATFFLTTGDGPFPYYYWWDRLAAALAHGAPVPPALTLDLPSGRREIVTSSDQDRLAAHWLVYHEIIRLPAVDRDAVVDQIIAWASRPSLDADDRRMTWDEMRDLASEPRHAIGAHTVEHLFLPAQPDDVLTRELTDSQAVLERVTGRRIDSLAYPYGAADQRTIAIAREAGFRLAVTCEDGPITPSDDRLALPRVAVMDEPLDHFIARVERAWTTA
jgi:peptidoglycan/xylan/chitin deacetylase (PgdA/CDA1 family)/SAM-dependent methyltransferase